MLLGPIMLLDVPSINSVYSFKFYQKSHFIIQVPHANKPIFTTANCTIPKHRILCGYQIIDKKENTHPNLIFT